MLLNLKVNQIFIGKYLYNEFNEYIPKFKRINNEKTKFYSFKN